MTRAHHAMNCDDVLALERAMGERIDARALQFTLTYEGDTVQNVDMSVKGNILTITVNLKAKTTTSKSGKSEVIGSTLGNVSVPGMSDVKVGLNVYRSAK